MDLAALTRSISTMSDRTRSFGPVQVTKVMSGLRVTVGGETRIYLLPRDVANVIDVRHHTGAGRAITAA